jgi:hypothetical protein
MHMTAASLEHKHQCSIEVHVYKLRKVHVHTHFFTVFHGVQAVNVCREPSSPFAGSMRALSFYKKALSLADIQILIANKAVPGSVSYVERAVRTVSLQSLEISSCSAEHREGGGILAHSGTHVTMQSVIVANNTADKGGGICVLGSISGLTPVAVKDSVIAGNTALEGAGMFFEDGTFDPFVRAKHIRNKLTVSHTEFAGNSAANAGGGLKIARLEDDWSVHTHAGQEQQNLEYHWYRGRDPDMEYDWVMSWYSRWTISPDGAYVYAT